MRFKQLEQWLAWQETLHSCKIDLGLARIAQVADTLGVRQFPCPVVVVAGTNGKGSCVELMLAVLTAAGYRVGTYNSPHLLNYNERIRINGDPLTDGEIMAAFAQIDQARGDTSLSYFEFATLAALVCFSHQPLDIIILEVGLGGRLDAVNIVDGDVAIISSIGLDHQAYLGHTREAIGLEKAGVIRRGKPVVIGDPDIPAKVVQRVQQVGASLYRQGIEFTCQQQVASWRWQGQTINGQPLSYPKLPLPKLAVQNAATSLQALALLALPVEPEAMTQGLEKVRLAGRLEMVAAAVPILLDVAHNSQAVAQLAGYLVANPVQGSNLAVFSALADKDVAQMISQLAPLIDSWYVAGLQVNRGLSTNQLITSVKQSVQASAKQPVTGYSDINQAYQGALAQAKPEDRLVVFGSFYTVAAIKRLLSAND